MSRGHQRERDLVNQLRNDDWFAVRMPGSLGICDVLALKAGHLPRMIEVKSDIKGPYEHFGPERRAQLRTAARDAGAVPELCWWPPYAKPTIIPASAWPARLEAVPEPRPPASLDALPPVFMQGRQR